MILPPSHPLWMLNSYFCGHQYDLSWKKTRIYIKTDTITCQYSVMEALAFKCHILNLSTCQLPNMTAPGHPPLWFLNSEWWGHQYDLSRNKTGKYIKTDTIPCQYSVMEALAFKCHILKLSTYQLPNMTAPGHPPPLWFLNSEWWGHHYDLIRKKTGK